MARQLPTSQDQSVLPQATEARTATLVSLDAEAAALRELRLGLARTPREIPCKYLYDDRGSELFEAITQLPEYFPTRTERALLHARAADIVRIAGGAQLTDVVEMGSGAASKIVSLLSAAQLLGGKPRYIAVDISAHALQRTAQILDAARPEVPFQGVLADYTGRIELPRKPEGGRRLVLFLGGTIGNDEDADAVAFLARVRQHVEPGDLFLLGANLVTDPAAIHAAYNDSRGVTAAFNRNLLSSVNGLVKSNFDPQQFTHYAPYLIEQRRIEMWLVAKRAQEVDLGRLGGTLKLRAGEGIRTEISRRFTRDDVLRLIDSAGYTPEEWMESPDGRFGLALGRVRAGLHDF